MPVHPPPQQQGNDGDAGLAHGMGDLIKTPCHAAEAHNPKYECTARLQPAASQHDTEHNKGRAMQLLFMEEVGVARVHTAGG